MDAGKDYFTDKGPFTTLEQLAQARVKVEETKRKYMVYYSERLHVEARCMRDSSYRKEPSAVSFMWRALAHTA